MTTNQVPASDTHSIIGSQARRAVLSTDGAACSGPEAAGWSRRSFLGVVGALAGGTLAGCAMGGSRGSVTDSESVIGNLGAAKKKGTGGGPGTAGAGYAPTMPYALTSQSVLSEDYFVVQNHNIVPDKDTAIAYSRTDGQVEAMVLQDGVVTQVYRDPTEPGGWGTFPLNDADGVIDMVAGVSTPIPFFSSTFTPLPARLLVFYVTSAHPDQLNVTWQTSPPAPGAKPNWSIPRTVAWNKSAGALKIAHSSDGSLLVGALVPSGRAGAGDAQYYYCSDAAPASGSAVTLTSGRMTGFDYDPSRNGRWSAVVSQCTGFNNLLDREIFLYLPGGPNLELQVWTGKLLGSEGQSAYSVNTHQGAPRPPQADLAVINVELLSATGVRAFPTAIVWTERTAAGAVTGNPRLWSVTFDIRVGDNGEWAWTELALPDSITTRATALPVSTGLTPRSVPLNYHKYQWGAANLLDLFVVVDNTLHVLRQVEQPDPVDDSCRPVYTPVIPLQPEMAAMTSQAGVSTGNELLVVGTDGTLQTLEKDPISGRWTDAVLHLRATDAQQVSSYRVTLILADVAWNNPVNAHDLTITASTPTVAMIEGPTPRTMVLGADAVTVTTDSQGLASIALLADGLSAPTLTITASGLPEPASVYPSGPVNTYMQAADGSTLNYLPTMSAATLAGARTPDGQKVAPIAAADPAAAADGFATMKQAADWGAQGARNGLVSSTVGRPDGARRGGARAGGHRPRGRAGTGVGAGVGVQALISSLDHWAHDALHAIKKGAIAVATVTQDVEKKVITLGTDAAHWADYAIQIVVHGIEDTAHVLHAMFNKLAADIVPAVKWLEAEVLGVFKAAGRLADKFEQWNASFCDFAATTLAADKTKTITWLKNEQNDITTKLTTLAGRYSSKTTLSTMAQDSPGRLGTRARPAPGRSRPATTAPLRAADDQQRSPHSDWFYNKIKHELAGSGLTLDLTNMPDLKNKIVNFGEKSLTSSGAFKDVMRDEFFVNFLKQIVSHPDDVQGIFVQRLLNEILKVINQGFDYAENIVAEAFDLLADIAAYIPKMLNDTKLKDLPILGALMRLIGLGDVSIGRVANLIFAFPTALVYKIAHGADAEPFASNAVARLRKEGSDPEASDLQISAASVMGTWALFDTASALFTAADEDGGIVFTAVDILALIAVTFLTTPATTTDGEPYFAPPVSGRPADVMGFLAWIFGAIPAFCAALPQVFEKTIPGDAQKRESYTQTTLWFQTLTGVLALVFGMIGNSEKDAPKGADYAGAVLNNMPTIASAGLIDAVKEATDGISIVVATALILICGESGAAIYGLDG